MRHGFFHNWMRLPVLIFLGGVFWLGLSSTAGTLLAQTAGPSSHLASESPTNYDINSFSAELHQLSQRLGASPSNPDLGQLRDSLPKTWVVKTPAGSYNVSTQPLRDQLKVPSAPKAKQWVDNLAEEVATALPKDKHDIAPARSALDTILKGSEFASVRPPSAMELLRRRIMAWLERLFATLFGFMGRHPLGGQILFWLLLAGGVLAIAALLLRFLAGRDRLAALPATTPAGVSRTWQEWLFAAREAAKRGDFREAVHSSYWAGIVRLQDTGLVPKDRSRTPREYVRLAAQSSPGGFAPAAQSQSLAGLTSNLERVWYARQEARAEDFEESLRQLEGLGCPLD